METTTTINSENLLTNSAYFLVMTNNTNCLWYKFSKINIWDWIISCQTECLEGNLEDWMTECDIEELTCLANRIEANAIYWQKRKKSLLNCQVFIRKASSSKIFEKEFLWRKIYCKTAPGAGIP